MKLAMTFVGLHLQDKALSFFSLAVFLLSTASYYLSAASDPGRCRLLLHDGYWLNSDLASWQPPGCMLHAYRGHDAASCLRDRRLVFFGGTSTLGLFEAVAKKFDPGYMLPYMTSKGSNVMFSFQSVRLRFVWDPYLEGSELDAIRVGSTDDSVRPAMTVIGLERDHFKKEDSDLTSWTEHIDSLMSDIRNDSATKPRKSDSFIFTPLLEPSMARLSPSPVDTFNDALATLSRKHGVDVAFAFNKIVSAKDAFVDSRYASPAAGALMADVLLNFRCNAQLPKQPPHASTCCNEYPRANWIQLLGFFIVLVLVPVAHLFNKSGLTGGLVSKFLNWMPEPKYHCSVLVFGAAVFYSWYCDRTNVFGKEPKQTSPGQFFVLTGLVILVSSFFTTQTAEIEGPFLNRDQTDEWKGWLLTAVLVYGYTGVGTVLWIYNCMMVVPTSYLFMTGWGHTTYYLMTEDYSFKRFTATMLRLNLLNIALAYAMGNYYLFYLTPLLTWNYLVVLAVLWPGWKYNKNIALLFSKMIVIALVNTAIYRISGVLEAMWYILHIIFRVQGDLSEWRSMVILDAYSVFPGMITGIILINWNDWQLANSPHWPLVKRVSYVASALIVIAYGFWASSQPSKEHYEERHTYLSWLPCCAFVILRNSTPWLRKTHNRFFVWLGRGFLESFLLSFHLWLAADAAGILTINFIPANQRVVNLLIITPPFIFVSSLVTVATGEVVQWITTVESGPVRPTSLPSYTSNTSGVISAGNSANDGLLTSQPQPDEKTDSTVALNGQADSPHVDDLAELEDGISLADKGRQSIGSIMRSVMATPGNALRAKVGLVLLAMVAMNWTYYL